MDVSINTSVNTGADLSALGDAEVVAIILESNAPRAAMAIDVLGGLETMARLTAPAMAEQPGVSLAKALRLAAAFELGRRVAARAAHPRERLCTSAAVARWFSARIGTLTHEELWVCSLDGRSCLRGARRVAQGGLHGCSVAARDILRVALADAASAIVLVHNHPSGDPRPSVDDVAMTRAVADAAHVVGVPLVDHVIVTGSEQRFASLHDLGLLEPAPASR